ncbi:MAG: DedA family protein, partial [Streptosporangiaceae bacterium]
FGRHGGKIITVARFIEGLRQANGIIAGISGMHWRRFFAFNALGAALWVGTWVSLGDLAGNHITTIYHDITKYSYYILILAVVLIAAYTARRLRRRQPSAPAMADEPGEAHETASTKVTPNEPASKPEPEPEPEPEELTPPAALNGAPESSHQSPPSEPAGAVLPGLTSEERARREGST